MKKTLEKKTVFASGLKKLFFATALLLALAGFSNVTFAETDSIVIEPAKTELSLAPGERTMKTVFVVNRSNLAAILKISVKDYIVGEDGKLQYLEKQENGAINWIVPRYTQISLMPLESKPVQFIVDVGEDMPAGGHYGSLIFENISPSGHAQKTFESHVLLNVNREGITTGLSINKFSSGILNGGDPVNFEIGLKNLGNAHILGTGNMSFTNLFGKKIDEMELGEMLIYPGSSELFKFEWQSHPKFGIFKASLEIKNPLNEGKVIKKEAWFAVLPVGMLSIASGFALLAAISFYFVFYPQKKKKVRARKRLSQL